MDGLRGKKVLVLLNAARDHRPFYTRVGKRLAELGATVHFALDSHYTDFLEPSDLPVDRTHYFSEAFRKMYGREDLPPGLEDLPIGRIMAPDIDRWSHTFFPPGRAPRYVHTLVASLAQWFDALFVKHRFDLVLYENVSNAFAYMAFEVAKRYQAKYMGFVFSRLPGRMDVLFGTQACASHIEERYRRLLQHHEEIPADVGTWVDSYLACPGAPDYLAATAVATRKPLQRYVRSHPLRRMASTVLYGLKMPEDAFHAFQVSDPFMAHAEHFAKSMSRVVRRPLVEALYYRSAPPAQSKYVLYPTQYHPESSTSVDAFGYEDEYANIRAIAARLPHGYRLVVRDHPLASAHPPLGFYEKVRRLPNVDFTGPSLDYDALLQGATAVVCASSSVGFDAILRGVPVFVLGAPFFATGPGCTRLGSYDALPAALAGVERRVVPRAHVRAFVAAYYMESVPSMFDADRMCFLPGAENTAVRAIVRQLQPDAAARQEASLQRPTTWGTDTR